MKTNNLLKIHHKQGILEINNLQTNNQSLIHLKWCWQGPLLLWWRHTQGKDHLEDGIQGSHKPCKSIDASMATPKRSAQTHHTACTFSFHHSLLQSRPFRSSPFLQMQQLLDCSWFVCRIIFSIKHKQDKDTHNNIYMIHINDMLFH